MRRTRYISTLVVVDALVLAMVVALVVALVVAVVFAAAGVAWAAAATNSARLRTAVTAGAITEHERGFQPIADAHTTNNKTWASGTSGFDASAGYFADERREAGYNAKVRPFTFPFFKETGPSALERLTPSTRVYELGAEYAVMEFSGDGDVTR